MRIAIDPFRQPGNDCHTCGRQIGRDAGGGLTSIGCCPPSAHDRHRRLLFRLERASNVEYRRRPWNLTQNARVGIVEHRHDLRAGASDALQHRCRIHLGTRREDGPAGPLIEHPQQLSLVRTPSQIERTETLSQAPQPHRSDVRDLRQRDQIRALHQDFVRFENHRLNAPLRCARHYSERTHVLKASWKIRLRRTDQTHGTVRSAMIPHRSISCF
jgi:hypothetical protein